MRRSTIVVRPVPGNRSRAMLQYDCLRLPAAIGRGGRTAFKREGDGATPIATMPLLHGFSRGDRVAGLRTPLPMHHIRKDMLWCDQPRHASYNRLVRAPFKPSHEEMMRKDGLYDVCLVMDWNITARRRHRGSAIFFHLIRPGYEPTAGCIAVSQRDMRRLIPFIRKGTVVRVM
ncbi:L,D-transpeptidase family protein [Rhizobiaceae bacterium n13]|uniref:L,D-transpeptidase family protein n=1 Tax=Ferirhizobium litorale TaxID=2927786 RepID=A0AAE3QDI5_9HYPH|nr:L,D-transpeptidase family protein [Fererhizobium litorale]MDI7862396.1 L,D-transpeptidase family protein [Fererhizobium litorale]MDI7923717.1 L,D-transpeptidase family protein [Fererhizobium litorale]